MGEQFEMNLGVPEIPKNKFIGMTSAQLRENIDTQKKRSFEVHKTDVDEAREIDDLIEEMERELVARGD